MRKNMLSNLKLIQKLSDFTGGEFFGCVDKLPYQNCIVMQGKKLPLLPNPPSPLFPSHLPPSLSAPSPFKPNTLVMLTNHNIQHKTYRTSISDHLTLQKQLGLQRRYNKILLIFNNQKVHKGQNYNQIGRQKYQPEPIFWELNKINLSFKISMTPVK